MKRLISSIVAITMIFSLIGCKDSTQQEIVIEDTISMNEHNQLMEDLKAEYESEQKDIQLPEVISEAIIIGSEQGLLGKYDIVYDISTDLSKYVFWDEAGLKLFEGSTKTVAEYSYIPSTDEYVGC